MTSARVAVLVLALASPLAAACGADVDLGGSSDAGSSKLDADAPDGTHTQCGPLVAPSVPSTCQACDASTTDCQPNGCYGGYWCNASARDCQPPPKTCN